MRGGEKVLAALGEMLPEADIFTHVFGMGMREKGEGLSWRENCDFVAEYCFCRYPIDRRK